MAQLQDIKTTIGDKVYHKYQIVLPTDIVEKVGWKPKDKLVYAAASNGRIIVSARAQEQKTKKMTYVEFRDAVQTTLAPFSEGLTWSEIRSKNPSLPLPPNALWVRQLERDIQLKREHKKGKMIWTIRK
jgi:bifunctional DNA-binding transcriptional regulator/antitoxin component of YhaV-PrlF toxin-antitoxin module